MILFIKNCKPMAMICFLLLSSLCSAADVVPEDTFHLQDNDKCLLPNFNESFVFGQGAVWVRRCEKTQGFTIYYRPEEAEPLPSGGHPCYTCYVSPDKECGVKSLEFLLESVSDFVSSDCWFLALYVNRYTLPRKDVLCATVTGIKEELSGQDPHNGLVHPAFGSFARHITCEEPHTEKGKRTIWSGCDGGAIWVSQEQTAQFILCYQPESGPRWLCYRYDLAQEIRWPKRWLKELQIVKNFALSQKRVFDQECCEDIPTLVAALKMALVGQTAHFDEHMCAWGQACAFPDLLKVQFGHCIVKGGRSSRGGTYQKGSAWIVFAPHIHFFRALTQDDELFQIAHPIDGSNANPNAQTPWVKQAVQFILGPQIEGRVTS